MHSYNSCALISVRKTLKRSLYAALEKLLGFRQLILRVQVTMSRHPREGERMHNNPHVLSARRRRYRR